MYWKFWKHYAIKKPHTITDKIKPYNFLSYNVSNILYANIYVYLALQNLWYLFVNNAYLLQNLFFKEKDKHVTVQYSSVLMRGKTENIPILDLHSEIFHT